MILAEKLEKISTKDDLKIINERIQNLEDENLYLKQKLEKQIQINANIHLRLECIEKNDKLKNLIFKGVELINDKNVELKVEKILKILLGENNTIIPIKSLILLKNKNSQAMILSTFSSFLETQDILWNAKKNYSIQKFIKTETSKKQEKESPNF